MFDFFRKHTRIFQFLLVLLIFPSFVFFGIEGYSSFKAGGNNAVAKVAGHKITQAEWDAAQRDQIERMRRQSPDADVKLLDTPEMRGYALDALVRDRVMAAAADDLRFHTTDERLKRLFATDPQLAAVRNPDGTVNKQVLAMQGMSSEGFAQRLRQELSVRQVLQGVKATTIAPTTIAAAALDPLMQSREVQVQRFDPGAYTAKVTPTDADLEAYYQDPANQAQFKSPETVNIEYVVLDLNTVKKGVTVPEAELRTNYEENKKRYTTPEQRRASHIQIKAEKGAPKADREKARARAEALLAELKKNPASFAEVAKKNSEDAGTAANGGDLDFITRDSLAKPFEDSVFALKPGEMSGLVETNEGYHIIKLVDARGGEIRSYESVRPELEEEIRTKLAQAKFSELAGDFTNMVYEQSDSLKPVADKFKLTVQQAQGLARGKPGTGAGPLYNAKLREAIFGSDAIVKKRNTDAIETGPSQLASARVVQHFPTRQLPLAEVKEDVRKSVVAKQASALARKDGEARVAELKKTPATTLEGAPMTVSRGQTANMPRPVIEAILRADASKLPAISSVDLGADGFVVIRVAKVLPRDPAVSDTPGIRTQFAQSWGEAEMSAYYESLKKRFKAEVLAPAAAASSPAL